MIPKHIDASVNDDDSDSVLSDSDEAALMNAALHFGEGLSRQVESNNNNKNVPLHRQRFGDANLFRAGSRIRGSESRTSLLSKESSTNSSGNSEHTLLVKNTHLDAPTYSTRKSFSSLSIHKSDAMSDVRTGSWKRDSPLGNDMLQIAEDFNEENTVGASSSTGSFAQDEASVKEAASHFQDRYGSKPKPTKPDPPGSNDDHLLYERVGSASDALRFSSSNYRSSLNEPKSILRSSLRMSGKKRRSNAEMIRMEIDDAAAVVTKMFEEGAFSDSDDDVEYPPRSSSRRSSARSQLSGPNFVDCNDERPRKRLSATSVTRRRSIGFAPNEESFVPAAKSSFSGDVGNGNTSVFFPPNQDSQVENNCYVDEVRCRAQRRKAFVVPTDQREAAKLQAERMLLLEKDRVESRLAKRGTRRSLSYSTGIKMKSNIIGTSLPEDSETSPESGANKTALEVQENPDLQRLKMNRVQRRVNSMPDPNAVQRLSESAVNTDVDFSAYPNYGAFEPRTSLPTNWLPTHGITSNLFNNMGPPLPITPHAYGPIEPPLCAMTTGTSISSNLSMTSSSLASSNQLPTAQPFFEQIQNNIELESVVAIQNLIAQTAEANQVIAQLTQSNPMLTNLRGSFRSNKSLFDDDSFDGKQSTVFAGELLLSSPTEYNAAILLNEACKKDDTVAVENILQKFPLTRHYLQGSDTGDITLHIGK